MASEQATRRGETPAFPFIGTMPATGVDNPLPTYVFHAGISKRELFAAMAMQGVLAAVCGELTNDELANDSLQAADALLAALAKETT